jgi:hypothetical protein
MQEKKRGQDIRPCKRMRSKKRGSPTNKTETYNDRNIVERGDSEEPSDKEVAIAVLFPRMGISQGVKYRVSTDDKEHLNAQVSLLQNNVDWGRQKPTSHVDIIDMEGHNP